MKSKILFILKYWLFFVTVFALQKPIFMLYHFKREVLLSEYLKVLFYGFPMDMTTAGYMTVLPMLITIATVWLKGNWSDKVLKIYSGIILSFISIILVSDIELFGFWSTHLDNTVLFYLKSPADAAASVSYWRIFFGFAIMAGLAFALYKALIHTVFRCSFSSFNQNKKGRLTTILALLTIILFIVIRGGIGVSTMNIGRVYFSSNMFLNLSAINPCFNFIYSLSHQNTEKIDYNFMSAEDAKSTFNSLKEDPNDHDFPRLLNQQRPNIILIVLESFSAKIVEPLGGIPKVAPRLNTLCNEGILFTNFYANSFRTDRGLLAVLSGMPSMPTVPLMRYPEKLNKIPSISRSLKEQGYDLSMLYGGDINFANMRQYFVCSGFEKIVSDENFPITDRLSKWGAPDHVTFNYLSKEMRKPRKQPFMQMFLTLSSHEPFEVPFHKFEEPYLNSIAYADSCLGQFIDDLKKQPMWKNSLVILIPDHSVLYPQTMQNSSPERYRIPMLWLGGAIKQPMRVDTLAAQSDLAATLLGQMNIPAKDFSFSRNFLKKSTPKMAFFSYINGFGFVTDGNSTSYDCGANQLISSQGKNAHENETKGKAMLQYLLDDFNRR